MKINKVLLNEMWRGFSRGEKPTNEQLEALFDETYWALDMQERLSEVVNTIELQLAVAP